MMAARIGLMMHMMATVRLYFDSVRVQLGGDMNVHPRQGPVLALLMSGDGLSQAELARRLHVSAATVAVSVARLERLGYVRREKNSQNQRANVLMLTETGRREAEVLQEALARVQEAATRDFTDDERRQMQGFCDRMADNLHAQYLSEEEKDHTCLKC